MTIAGINQVMDTFRKLKFVATASDGKEYDYTSLVHILKDICPGSPCWQNLQRASAGRGSTWEPLAFLAGVCDPADSVIMRMAEMVKDHLAEVVEMDAQTRHFISMHFQYTLNEFLIQQMRWRGAREIVLLWNILECLRFPATSYLRTACIEARDYEEAARCTRVGERYSLTRIELPFQADVKTGH